MEATPSDQTNPKALAEARRARRILFLAMAVMIGVPLLLFVLFHT